jgi:predicted RNase H-like HicB family nuclease
MPDTVEITIRLRCFVRSEREFWVAGCPSLDVFSQADTADEARRALREAVELWVESCLERETLEQALRQVGWHLSSGFPVPPQDEDAAPGLQSADEVLGEPFPLEVTIPAFHAAAVAEPGASRAPTLSRPADSP